MTESEARGKIKYHIGVIKEIAGNRYDVKFCEDLEIALQVMKEIREYRAIGTVKEFKALKEKNTEREPLKTKTDEKTLYMCPCCRKIFIEKYDTVQRGHIPKYCGMCGQNIKWSWGK